MNTRPILFSAPMIRALLAGSKKQTRRILKPQPQAHHWHSMPGYRLHTALLDCESAVYARFAHTIPQNPTWDWERDARCPYGRVGDLLWVRETASKSDKDDDGCFYEKPIYRADITDPYGLAFVTDDGARYVEQLRWRPSIHMPRSWSRLTLRITDVRVQRLQDIDEADAQAEGCGADVDYTRGRTYVREFSELWQSINGADSWAANPWVWAISFDVIHANVDQVMAQREAA